MTAPGSGARRLGAVVSAAAMIASTVVARSTDWSEVDPAAALLPDGLHVRDVRSEKVGDTLRIFIGEPVDSQPSDRPAGDAKAPSHPVIYVLDGNGAFLDVLLIARQLVETADVPPAVVVGIGYPVDSFQQTMNLRSRDYTPTADPDLLAVANRTMWPGLPDAKAATSGRAEAFLDFIQSELMPMIEGEFGGDPHDATIVGHSFGGLLAAYALVARSGLFQRYVISSPALWWGDGYVLGLERKLASDRRDLPGRAFFSIGGLEAESVQRETIKQLPPEAVEGTRPSLRAALSGIIPPTLRDATPDGCPGRAVPHRGCHRGGRHGGGLPSDGYQPQAARRHQGAAGLAGR